MSFLTERFAQLDELLVECRGVLSTEVALRYLSYEELRSRVESGRWQHPYQGILVAHSGPLSQEQVLRVALLWAGTAATLAGLTAARLDGFKGFDNGRPLAEGPIHVLVPRANKVRGRGPKPQVVVHYTRSLDERVIHPVRAPRRTRIDRSLVDAASWMPTDRGAMAVLAAGVQQRLVLVPQLREIVEERPRLHRRKLILETLDDIEGGDQALSELDFTRKVVRAFGLPEPDRQVSRRDEQGRQRWLDAAWERWKVAVEIDGAQHTEPLQSWKDMDRDIDLQLNDDYVVLRFPAWVVRRHPEYVARKLLKALQRAGWRPQPGKRP